MADDAFGLIGKVLGGQFRVDELVGEGGFSVVYKGFHMGLKEPVAIKCLRLPQLEKKELADQFAHRFRDESRIAYRLSQGNLNIVRSITSGTTQDARGAVVPYMVLEWLSGETLAGDFRQRRDRGLRGRSVAEVMPMFATVAEALSYAHSHGVIHRDVKPQNLFLAKTREGVRLKVLDFGMAKILSDGTLGMAPLAQSMGTSMPVFSPPYAAPEQFDWKVGLIGTWTDVYSFAMVLLEALADARVRTGESLAECMVQACDPKRKVRPREMGIPLGNGMDEVLARALSLKPKERPQDMSALWAELSAAHRTDAERLPSIPVTSSDPPEEIKTAVTDTRSLFDEAELRNNSPLDIKTAPRPFTPGQFMPHDGRAEATSDAPTVSVEQPPQARMPEVPGPPAAPRLDQTLVTPPPVHEKQVQSRTLFGQGPVDPKLASAPRSGVNAPSPSGHQPSALSRTLALGSTAPSPTPAARRGMDVKPPEPVAVPPPSEPTIALSPDAAAPPVVRAPNGENDDTQIALGPSPFQMSPFAAGAAEVAPPRGLGSTVAMNVVHPPAQPAQPAEPSLGFGQQPQQPHPQEAQPAYPPQYQHQQQQAYPPPDYQQQQQHQYDQQGQYAQTAGYAPVGASHHAAPPNHYGPPPASPYGPPPMGAGDGYVNVAPAERAKKAPVALFVALGLAAVLLLSGIGFGAYYITRSRMVEVTPPAAPTHADTSTPDVPPVAVPVPAATPNASGTAVVDAAPPPLEPASATPPTPPEPPPPEPKVPVDPKPEAPPTVPDTTKNNPVVPKTNPAPVANTKPPALTPTPKPTPSAAPSSAPAPVDPNAFNPEAAKGSLRAMEGILASCKKPDGPTGPGKVKVTFANSGAVSSVEMVGAPYAGTPVGDCASSRFKMARVTPFEGSPGVVDYAFRINK